MLYFFIVLLVFHPIQWICLNLFGQKAHQASVNLLNFFLVYGWILTGSSIECSKEEELPTGRSIIFVANHRSMFDIPGIIWFWRHHTPLFVSKKELAKGIPSISFNLRHGGAALIDRKDGKAAVMAIARLGKLIHEKKFSAAIFPEGTRSKNGKLKAFKAGGVAALLKKCPDALIVPIAIEGTGLLNPKGIFPLTSFTAISFKSLPSFEPKGLTPDQVVEKAHKALSEELL